MELSQAKRQSELVINLYHGRVSRREHGDPQIEELNIGEAAEPEGRGTGMKGLALSFHQNLGLFML